MSWIDIYLSDGNPSAVMGASGLIQTWCLVPTLNPTSASRAGLIGRDGFSP